MSRYFWLLQLRGRVLLISSGWKPRMLENILKKNHKTFPSYPQQRLIWLQISTVLEVLSALNPTIPWRYSITSALPFTLWHPRKIMHYWCSACFLLNHTHLFLNPLQSKFLPSVTKSSNQVIPVQPLCSHASLQWCSAQASFIISPFPAGSSGNEGRLRGCCIPGRLKQILYLELRSLLRAAVCYGLESGIYISGFQVNLLPSTPAWDHLAKSGGIFITMIGVCVAVGWDSTTASSG